MRALQHARPAVPRPAAAAAAAGAGRVAAHAVPRGRRPKRSPRGGGARQQQQQPELTGDALVRQLNASHPWLPAEDSDFGLDDVAAHAASRNSAQPLDLGSSPDAAGASAGRKGRSAAQAGGDAATLAQIPASGRLPEWVEELRSEGFDVLGRNGELFLQRGSVGHALGQPQQPQQQQQQQQRPHDSSSRNSSSSSSSSRNSSSSSRSSRRGSGSSSNSGAQAAAQLSLSAAAEKSLAVRTEFDPLVWERHISSSTSRSSPTPPASSSGTWYSSEPGPAPGSGEPSLPQACGGAQQAPRSSPASVKRLLLGFSHPEQLLALLEAVFPAWAANSCWLLDQRRPGWVVPAPTPAEAAIALKGVALAAKRAGFSALQTQGLARERLVLGLLECLRLTPPRSPGQSQGSAALSRRLWSIAKAYWRQAGASAAAAQQVLLAASAAAAGSKRSHGAVGTQPPLNSAAPLQQQQQQQQQLAARAGTPSLGSLLVQLQSSGLPLSRQALSTAASLIQSRSDDALRRDACVAGLWGLSAIGGHLFFEQEMDALCQVAAPSRWRLTPSELSDVLWALANARHWTPLLPQLEAALLAAGGVAACSAPELITVLWACATLCHTPAQLLAQLEEQGWAVKAARQQGRQRQQAGTAPASPPQPVCRLAELSGSQLAALAWSLACLQHVNGRLFRDVWGELCSRGTSLADDTRQLVQVAQAALAVRLEADWEPLEGRDSDEGARALLAAAAKAFAAQGHGLAGRVHSSYQRSIAAALGRMRVMHVLEDSSSSSSGYAIDISLPGARVAIEADGPSHFSRTAADSGGPVQLGATAMKARHLTSLGWAVVNVPFTQWDGLTTDQARCDYLQRRVAAACAARRRQPAGQAAAAGGAAA